MRRARLSPFPAVMLLVVAPNTERAGGWICERCGTWLISDGNVKTGSKRNHKRRKLSTIAASLLLTSVGPRGERDENTELAETCNEEFRPVTLVIRRGWRCVGAQC